MQTHTEDIQEVKILYQTLLTSWNNNDAAGFAALFNADGNIIGFDGSQMNGPKEIEAELSRIFANHKVDRFTSIVREIRAISRSVFVLRAVAGMVPPGGSGINPNVNAIQTLVAKKEADKFRIAVFQNTPAAFHGRPELSEALTKELQDAYDKLS